MLPTLSRRLLSRQASRTTARLGSIQAAALLRGDPVQASSTGSVRVHSRSRGPAESRHPSNSPWAVLSQPRLVVTRLAERTSRAPGHSSTPLSSSLAIPGSPNSHVRMAANRPRSLLILRATGFGRLCQPVTSTMKWSSRRMAGRSSLSGAWQSAHDATTAVLPRLRARRPSLLFSNRAHVFDGKGRLIGAVAQRWPFWRQRYDLFAAERQFARIDGGLLAARLVVTNSADEPTAFLEQRRQSGALSDGALDVRFEGAALASAAGGLTREQRAVVLAAAVDVANSVTARRLSNAGSAPFLVALSGHAVSAALKLSSLYLFSVGAGGAATASFLPWLIMLPFKLLSLFFGVLLLLFTRVGSFVVIAATALWGVAVAAVVAAVRAMGFAIIVPIVALVGLFKLAAAAIGAAVGGDGSQETRPTPEDKKDSEADKVTQRVQHVRIEAQQVTVTTDSAREREERQREAATAAPDGASGYDDEDALGSDMYQPRSRQR